MEQSDTTASSGFMIVADRAANGSTSSSHPHQDACEVIRSDAKTGMASGDPLSSPRVRMFSRCESGPRNRYHKEKTPAQMIGVFFHPHLGGPGLLPGLATGDSL